MLTLNPARIVQLRHILKPFAHLRKNGFSHHTTYLLLHSRMTSVKLEHIERLCHLLNCTPNDLLSYTPEPGAPEPAQDTLTPLVRPTEPIADLNTFFQQMPIDRIETITRELTDRLGNNP